MIGRRVEAASRTKPAMVAAGKERVPVQAVRSQQGRDRPEGKGCVGRVCRCCVGPLLSSPL